MSEQSVNIKNLSDEIIRSLPFLLDSRVNEAAAVVIYNNMEECLKLSSNSSDMQFVGNAFQMCVTYAKKYNIDGLMKACSRWNDIACDKLDSFKREEESEELVSSDSISQRLDRIEAIVNNPDISDREELLSLKEDLNSLEDEVKSSVMDSNTIKSIRYRIAMLRESLNVSLVIIADMSSVHRLLKNARRYS